MLNSRSILLLTLAFLLMISPAGAVTNAFTITTTTTFTPLHTYFMAATGCSDANAGTSAGSPWCSPNHAVVCGDVIIAAAGSYTNDMATQGTVSNCPSTTGGIDGTGGIYMAVIQCGASDITGCKIDCGASAPCNGTPGFGPQAAINLTKSNWAVEGWNLTCGTVIFCVAMQASGSGTGCTGTTQYQAFINNYTYKNGQAFDTQACNTTNGPDYVGVVGNIAQDSVRINFVNNGICIGAIDIIAPGVSDADTTHTHFFIYNNYSFDNIVTGCDGSGAPADGEDFLVDSIDNNGVKGIIVHANNIGYFAQRNCINYTYNGNNPTLHPTMRFYNNTCYDNYQRDTLVAGGNASEVFIGYKAGNPSNPWNFQTWNNILYAPTASNGQVGSDHIYPLFNAQQPSAGATISVGSQVVTGGENVLSGAMTSCDGAFTCDSTFSFMTGSGFPTNINTYQNPNFANTSDLITNHLGVPVCTGFTTTTACLGWSWSTQSASSLSVIADLTASCAGCAGKGFQPPTNNCTSIANQATLTGQLVTDFPVWLKGLIHLRWTGSIVVQEADLANVPCGK